MSHEVEQMGYMVDAGQAAPWHASMTKERTVAITTQPATKSEALRVFGLDWMVETVPVFAQIGGDGNEQFVPAPMAQAVRRVSDGSILSVVGADWHPVQNDTAFQIAHEMRELGLADYETAGSLKHGKLVWIAMRVNGEREIVSGDTVKQYIVFVNGHSGEVAPQYIATLVRPVCANTVAQAMNYNLGVLRLRHSLRVEERMQRIGDILKPALVTWDQTIEMFKLLAAFQMTSGAMDEFLDELYPLPKPKEGSARTIAPEKQAAAKKRAEVKATWEGPLVGGDGVLNSTARFSAWTAYQAVTEFVDHKRGRSDSRVFGSMFGGGKKERDTALDLLCKIANVERVGRSVSR
jgi:phage/plasmid-like protein (TIGR03299 family)